MNRLLKAITGDIDHKKESKNKIARWLDVGSNPEPNKLKGSFSFFTKFNDPRWGRNLVETFMNADKNALWSAARRIQSDATAEEKKESEAYVGRYFDRVKKLDKFFNQTTRQLDRSTINKLYDHTSGKTHDMLRILAMKDEDMVNEWAKLTEEQIQIIMESKDIMKQSLVFGEHMPDFTIDSISDKVEEYILNKNITHCFFDYINDDNISR
jgi:hypothetical protein